MKPFFKNVLRFLILPAILFVLLLIGYVIYDPFYILRPYDRYSSLQMNRGYISTEVFLKNYKAEHYNSFIFGSSRIFGYNIESWKGHLDADAKVYSFDAFTEKAEAMYHKLELIDSLGLDIKNALFCFDIDYTFDNTFMDPQYLYIEHPLLSGESWSYFHAMHLLGYFQTHFILSFYGNKFFGLHNDYVNKHYLLAQASFDPKTNRPFRSDLEERIKNDPNYYNSPIFYPRSETLIICPPQVDKQHEEILDKIKQMLVKHNTNYRIVINPHYSQWELNPKDLDIIAKIFGHDHVYDFSGQNTFTKSKYNYYEHSHFRPFVGDSIMNIIYK